MRRAIAITTALLFALPALPQSEPPAQKTLAATMNIYAFPTKGQKPEQQSQDEAECYKFAEQQTGTDPFALQQQSEAVAQRTEAQKQQAAQAGKGAGARGAMRGAAAGALVGEIASDDPGEGAAWGAAAGAVAGRSRRRQAQAQATQQAEAQGQQAQAATAEQMTNFKKAFSVCLEAKNYMVKY